VIVMTKIYPFQRTARWISLAFLTAALLLGGWVNTSAQEGQVEPEEPKPGEPGTLADPLPSLHKGKSDESPQLDKKKQDPAPLSPHHAMFETLVGNWTAQVRMYMEPGQDPVESEGRATNGLILGGRALRMDYKGRFMDQEFSGIGLDGYDADKGQHFSFWMDTMSAGATYVTGNCTHGGMDVVRLNGECQDPETGETLERETVMTVLSSSRYTYEERVKSGDGEPTLTMQIIFTKVK